MNHIHGYLFRRQLDQRIAQGFDGTVHVSLHDDVQLLETTQSDTAAHFVESQNLLRTQTLLTLQLLALVRDFASLLFRIHHMERITGCRCTVQTQNRSCLSRADFFHTLVTLIEHGLHTTVVRTGQHDVPYMQRSVRHQYRSHVTASLIQRRLDDGTGCLTVRIGFQV